MMMKPFAPVFWSLALLLFSGCEYFETKVPASEIQKATQWSAKDQFPSFAECEDLEISAQQTCFRSVLSDAITNYLAFKGLVADAPTQGNLTLQLLVDKAGHISLLKIDDPDDLSSKIADLTPAINQAVAQLPQALPATKTNVGTFVNITIELPIQIEAITK
jgi:hypothetical protein